MANSAKGAGNFLGPLFIVATLVVVALAVTFWISDEEVPNEATIIAEDDVEARPVGAGTIPEGEIDEEIEGITDELDEVDPAAPGEETIPPAQESTGNTKSDAAATESGSDSGETSTASDAPALDPVDESSGDGQQGDAVENPSVADAPAGRDAEVELNPDEGQDIVEDTDDGGTAFIPTPSGPKGQDGETIAD